MRNVSFPFPLLIQPGVTITFRAKCSQVRSIASLEFETQMRSSPRLDNVEIPAKITWRYGGAPERPSRARSKGYGFYFLERSLRCLVDASASLPPGPGHFASRSAVM